MQPTRSNTDTYSHTGIISKMGDRSLVVSLDENVHCESCRAKATCGITDATTKQIEITDPEGIFQMHEPVQVVLQKQLGLKAVFWAYVFPFILMLATLLIGSVFLEEWLAGLLSLGVLVPYYLTLYVLRDAFKKTFRIAVLKLSS
ncbi:SoxR reducing system RseC family protein [Flavobacteriaceae bacterium TP-CH-4]|uniref:SoxR reducing system RseC family protein n=1 Tax=Pelagihabitans pacificus TaxID=2696054 RepID=A0A967AR40_9FLAO|nr:SoxR reducing system RseC family protein [Pelagihabitans pacificus]NHF58629.1 SoxR reducing system RseC family protein [Pelagihabitans pacificus]